MNWLTKPTVAVAMLISIPTAACQVSHNWGGDPYHAAKSRDETSIRTDSFSSAGPQNIDRSLERNVQQAQSDARTIRQDENVRSGGTRTGGSGAPAPGTTGPGK